MDDVIMWCAILATAAIVTGTVFFILTLLQIRRTAKEFETVGKALNMLSPVFSFLLLGGGVVSTITKKISGFFQKNVKGGKKNERT
jgi:hypothetical protein